MKDKKLYKVVFTLTSGKSIVYTMSDENALKVFDDWKKFKSNEDTDLYMAEVTKTKEGQITEKLGVDFSKIDAIQIDDNSSSL